MPKLKNQYTTQIKNDILIIRFNNQKHMNNILDPLSNTYEGTIINRIGHNFPISYIPENHILAPFKVKAKYVVGIYNFKDLKHELLHAKYYLDPNYKKQINDEWNNLTKEKRNHITNFLKKLSYSDSVIIDEYQAYKYSEKPGFFE
jgi:hypothetical protein